MPIKITVSPSVYIVVLLSKMLHYQTKKRKKKRNIYMYLYSPLLGKEKMFLPHSRSIKSFAQGFQYSYKVIRTPSCNFRFFKVSLPSIWM